MAKTLNSEEVLDRFLEELKFEIAKAGRGIQARLQRTLGLRTGYIHDMFRHRYVELGKAVAVVDALGLDVLSFFERVLGSAVNVVDSFAREGALLGGALPAIVKRAAERFRGRTPPPRTVGTGRAVPHAYRLPNIVALIERHPHEAARQAEREIALCLELKADVDAAAPVAQALGYYATACCHSGRARTAHQALSVGLEIASTYGLRSVVAHLTCRGVEVLRCRHANAAALRLAGSALRLYEEMGDPAGRALALLEEGLLLERVGRSNAALESLSEALELLPNDDERSRFIASWALARITLRASSLADAERHAAVAAGLAPGIRSAATGWVYRLQATIAGRHDAPDQAEAYLQQAEIVFAATSEYHGMVLVTTELMRLQRLRGAEAEACRTAQRLLPFALTHLARNRSAMRALRELLTAARERQLTTEAIDRVVQAIEQSDPEIRWR